MRRRRTATPRPRAALLGAVAVTAIAAAVAASLLGSQPTVLPQSPPGTMRADALDDGRPVLVSTPADGEAVVLDARVPVGEGWVGVAGWCEVAGAAIDRLSARQWTIEGHPRLPAGPGRAIEQAGTVAPPLARYAIETAEGRIRVGARQPPDPEAPVHEVRRFRLCPPDEVAAPPLPGTAVALTALLETKDGWHRVDATLDLAATPPRLCGPTTTPPCDGPALPPLPDAAHPLASQALSGTVAVRVRDGRVDRVWVPADAREVR